MTKAWFDDSGKCIKTTSDDVKSVEGAAGHTRTPPQSGRQIWDGSEWTWPQEILDRRYIPSRRERLIEQTRSAKGYPEASVTDGLGFWVDAIMGWAEQEIAAGRLQPTPEMTALLNIRKRVKRDIPKPE